ncbi:hypothetical protein [Streptomyces sp. 900105245]
MEDETQALVIDIGSGVTKAGFAGDENPRAIFPTIVGKAPSPPAVESQSKPFVGTAAISANQPLSLTCPVQFGRVANWDDFKIVLHHIFYNELKVAPEGHPVLLTEPPDSYKGDREKCTQILFENFNVPAFYIARAAVLSLYAAGRSSGVVLDAGEDFTCTVPIKEGFVVPNAIMRLNYGGKKLTEYMGQLLSEAAVSPTVVNDKRLVQDIKEKMCYVALDLEEELQQSSYPNNLAVYTTPDGQKISLSTERFRCPEGLFRPSDVGADKSLGIHEMTCKTISQCDQDMQSILFQNIVLSGGTTMFNGIGDRLQREIASLSQPGEKIKIVAPPRRQFATWIGGSIQASLSTFQSMWIRREEYDDSGPEIVNQKCF